MSQPLSPQIAQQLNNAFQAIQQGRAKDALPMVNRLLRKIPRNADVLHIAALAHKANGDLGSAEQFFTRCLSVAPNHPQVLNNFANLKKSQLNFKSAETNYKKAIKFKPDYLDAIRNLAICQIAQEDLSAAEETLKRALILAPDDVSSLTALADCQRKMGEYAAAQSTYQTAIDKSPKAVNALHNLGLNHHLQGELTKARQYYQQAFELAPEHPTMLLSFANSVHESGDTEQAMQLLKDAVEKHPDRVSVHKRLNELLFEQGDNEQFGKSYQRAIQQLPDRLDLLLAFAHQLFRSGDTDQTLELIDDALANFPESPALNSLHGQVLADLGDFSAAQPKLESSLALTFDKTTAQQLIKLYLIQSDYERAQALISPLQSGDPHCQLSWALQGLIWKFTDVAKYQWLCDYDQLVRPYTISTPNGYRSQPEFLGDLEEVLLGMHKTEHAPLEQTLRHGSQTAARLLHTPNPILQVFKQCLDEIVRDYISIMPSDSDHPLFSRKSADYSFSGSWSVKLQAQGFHVNHVHPAGWISSSSYITIPSSVQDEANAGAIKFGESPLGLGERDSIEKLINPAAGMVVLFPSYLWHGTVPFSGSEQDFRLTAPFDVLPA